MQWTGICKWKIPKWNSDTTPYLQDSVNIIDEGPEKLLEP